MSESHKVDPIQGEIVHEYDGILEADNHLPRWWLNSLFATVIFSAGYWFYFQEFKASPGPTQAYYAEVAREAEKSGADPTESELLAAAIGPQLPLGKQAFLNTCAACHEAGGQGKIGPNLTDAAWLHGGAPLDIFRTIRDGVPAKGMPSWGPVLGRAGVVQVTAFVLSIRDTNVAGKMPEGKVYDDKAKAAAELAPADGPSVAGEKIGEALTPESHPSLIPNEK